MSRTQACATKTLYAVMQEIVRRGGSIPAKDIYPWVNRNVELTDEDKNLLPLQRIAFLGSNE